MYPKIGIVICGFHEDRQFVPNVYIQSIRYSKGIPFLIPLVRSDRLINEYVRSCDGFLFCGGEDITPLLFGEEPQKGNGKTDITVDLFQIRFMKRILASHKPVLAVCRGMQILNVACGGTVWQDLSLAPQPVLDHMQHSSSRGDVSHRIKIDRGSKLKQFLGSCLYVKSFPHQAVNTLGKNIRASARSHDGVIEAIELLGHPFTIGVQWHPECMYRTSPEMRSLFHEFIAHSLINNKNTGHSTS